ncbi:hypothetical protein [Shewanella japonica]|uniref:DUF2303 family protein n=1 Tax=Shewanella japonica TaxID=93973 RepID=A0ABN4YN73_9GAMM|nr:hypothetical protein [Shewanella japonica]ARD23119.1 hypothetical protein SJ2017_2838 [Shewanella japonica]
MALPIFVENIRDIFQTAALINNELIIRTNISGESIFSYPLDEVTPKELLRWGKKDLKGKDAHARSNGITNAKKSIDLLIEQNLKSLNISVKNKNVTEFIKKSPVLEEGGNSKTQLIASLGIAPSILISDIWAHRNDAEHEYLIPPLRDVKQAIEVAELLMLSNDTRERQAHNIEIRDVKIENLGNKSNEEDPFRLAPIPMGVIFSWEFAEKRTLFKLQYNEFKEGNYQSYIYEFKGYEHEYLLLIKASFCEKTYDREEFESTIEEFLEYIYGKSFRVREFQYNDPQ